MSKHLVISRYEEDLKWLTELVNLLEENEEIDYTILTPKEDFKRNNKHYKKIEDTSGFEVFSFLSWIIDNYNNLPDLTVFLQGDPFDQLMNKDLYMTIRYCKRHIGYMPLGQPCQHYIDNNLRWTIEITNRMRIICKDLGLEFPRLPYLFPISSQMILNKEMILSRSKEFYEDLRDYSSNPIDLWTEWRNGKSSYYCHAIERLWSIIYA